MYRHAPSFLPFLSNDQADFFLSFPLTIDLATLSSKSIHEIILPNPALNGYIHVDTMCELSPCLSWFQHRIGLCEASLGNWKSVWGSSNRTDWMIGL